MGWGRGERRKGEEKEGEWGAKQEKSGKESVLPSLEDRILCIDIIMYRERHTYIYIHVF